MRSDAFARALDERRWPNPIEARSAVDLRAQGLPPIPGKEVAARYGLLAHYLAGTFLPTVLTQGYIGSTGGTWLTPTPYPACLAPYNLGLYSPRDLCMLIDVSTLDGLWGPATAERSISFPAIWQGGAIEFFFPGRITLNHVRDIVRLQPCGDTHV